jgi:hypothetical protein
MMNMTSKSYTTTRTSSRIIFTILMDFLRFFYTSWRLGSKVHPWIAIFGNAVIMLGTSQPPGPQFWSLLVNPWDPELAKICTRPYAVLSGVLIR